MPQDIFTFSDPSLDEQEKLRELIACVSGCAQQLCTYAKRMETYHDFLDDETEGNPRAQDFLHKAKELDRQIEAVAAMLENIQDDAFEGENLPLAPVLSGVISRCSSVFDKNKVHFDLDCPEDLNVFCDVFQLQQLFYAMLEAFATDAPHRSIFQVKANKQTLTTKQLRQFGSDCPEGNYAIVDVFDATQNSNLPPAFSHLCDANPLQGPPTLERPVLAMWLGILKQHKGDLLFALDNGKINAFRMLLSLDNARDSQIAQPDDTPQENNQDDAYYGSETILLVDDEDMIWDLAITTLTDLGYTVLLAANGQEAIDMYRENMGVFDLVIMDMVMPGVNGREAFEQLKRLDPDVKVLMSSGYASDEDAHFVMQKGALGFLRKPYRMRELAKTVRKILDQDTSPR